MERLLSLVREAHRRRVFRVAGIYIVAAWVVVQVADTTFPGINVPDVAIRYVWLAAFLGFPLALVFGWRYDITERGVVRTLQPDPDTNVELALRRTDYVILALLAVVAAAVIYQLIIQISGSRSMELAEVIQREIEPRAIAVLPLDNLSGDPEQAYFVEGMQEALIAGLSQVSEFTVISRTSTRQFASSKVPLPQIAQQLGAAKIIEGSVYRVADQVRITLQLIDAESDRHLLAKSYERDLTDILKMQGEVASDIAMAVKVRLTEDESERFDREGVTNPRAYDAYLLGKFHGGRFTPQDMKLSEEHYRRAIEIDPDYALAYVGLSGSWAQRITGGIVQPSIGGPQWLATVRKAIELDPNSAEAQAALAAVMAWYEWDWEAAERAYERAIELNPNLAGARIFYSHFLTAMGNPDKAQEQIERALELDPLNSISQALYGAQLVMVGRTEEAVSIFRNIYKRDPGMGFGYVPFLAALYAEGLYEEALGAARARWTIFGDFEVVTALDQGAEEGGFERAMLNVAELLEERSTSGYVSPMQIASAFDYGGNPVKAIEWLEKAYEARSSNMVYLAVIPFSEAVRSDARFVELLRRLNLPSAAAE